MIPETTAEWLMRYEKKRDKACMNYQQTGEARYDKQNIEYDVICDALMAKLEKEQESDERLNRRIVNKNAVIDKLIKQEYTRAEVIELLNSAVWW